MSRYERLSGHDPNRDEARAATLRCCCNPSVGLIVMPKAPAKTVDWALRQQRKPRCDAGLSASARRRLGAEKARRELGNKARVKRQGSRCGFILRRTARVLNQASVFGINRDRILTEGGRHGLFQPASRL